MSSAQAEKDNRPDLSGTVLGDYRLDERLGRGGMGEVYRATGLRTGRIVALKVLSTQKSKDASLVTRFEREWRILREVVHPNVVTLLDWPREQGPLPYFVMELLDGGTLDHWFPDNLPFDVAVDVLRQLTTGLDAVHAAGIVHRDLKPENIFVCGQEPLLVKILDFGLARVAQSQITGTGVLVGTPSYVAPEQITGDKVDARADIYSLGLVMYRAITGHHPFVSDDQVVTLGHQLLSPPPPLSWLREETPAGLEALILSMLRKKPEDRPASMLEVRDAADQLLRELDEGESSITERVTIPPNDSYGPLNPLAQSLVSRTLRHKGFRGPS